MRRRRTLSDEEVADLARALIGCTLPEARRRAGSAGCTVRDRSEPGWYTSELAPRRIDVVVRDGIVVDAEVG